MALLFLVLVLPAMSQVPLQALDCGDGECGSGLHMLQTDLNRVRHTKAAAAATKSYKAIQQKRELNTTQACEERPWSCEAPYNCQDYTDETQETLAFHKMATEDNRSNLQGWCSKADSSNHEFIDMVEECRTGSMPRSALIGHEVQGREGLAVYGDVAYVWNIDASDCFANGGCTNTEITENTTVEEAEAMCDRRYGREAWASFQGATLGVVGPPWEGEHEDEWRLLACAMGNYHCDIFYCRVNYCNDPKMIKKYAHLTLKDPLLPVEGQEKSPDFFFALHPEHQSLYREE